LRFLLHHFNCIPAQLLRGVKPLIMPSRQAQRQRPKATKTADKLQKTAVKAAALQQPGNILQQNSQETYVRNASAAGALAFSPVLSTEALTLSTTVTQTESLEITKTILHSSVSIYYDLCP
jgi:hypothetical protein